MCRSTLSTPPSGSRSCSPTAPPCCSRRSNSSTRLPEHDATVMRRSRRRPTPGFAATKTGAARRRERRPTSSTRRARPGRPKGVVVKHAQRRPAVRGDRAVVRLRAGRRVDAASTRSRSTSRSGRSGARCSTAGGWSSCPYWVSRVARRVPRASLRRRARDGAEPDPVGVPPAHRATSCAGGGRRSPLRYVIFGGEALEPASAARRGSSATATTSRELVNMYGITETTVHVTYRPIDRRRRCDGDGSLIGGRSRTCRSYVLDARLQPVPGRRRRRDLRRRRRRRARLPRAGPS